MVKVLFHIPIQDGFHGGSNLLETIYDLDFLPDEGDYFHPLKNDPESGLSMEVRRRWWTEDGSVQIETHKYIVDPPDDANMMHFSKIYRTWWSDRDGDLIAKLLENGWWHYGQRPENESSVDDRVVNMQFTQNVYGETLEAADIYRKTKEILDIAEKRIREGVASAEEVVHYLRFGTWKEKREEGDDDQQ